MLIGCCTRIENLGLVKEAGFDYIELAGKVVAKLAPQDFEDLLQNSAKLNLPTLAANAYCDTDLIIAGPGFSEENTRNYAAHLARRAAALGMQVVNIGSPKSRILPDAYDRKLADQQALDFYRVTAAEFEKFGINVTIEALAFAFCNYINTLDEAVELASRLSDSPNIGIVLDFYNMRGSGEGDADITKASPYILHVHDSDDAGDPYLRSFYHPENEAVHMRDIQQLSLLGYEGLISVETDVVFDIEQARYSIQVIRSGWNKDQINHLPK